MRNIMDYYPYENPYESHIQILQTIEREWKNFDVFLLILPTAFGKTATRRTIAYYAGDAAMLVPTNNLINQELDEFGRDGKILKRELYTSPSEYARDIKFIRERGKPILSTPAAFVAHKIQRKTLIWDEGHKAVEVNKEMNFTQIWEHDFPFDGVGLLSRQDLVERIQFEIENNVDLKLRKREKLKKVLDKLSSDTDYMIKREFKLYRGKRKPCLSFIPLSPELHPSFKRAEKIILLSATLSKIDVHELGISRDARTLIIEAPSPIAKERRPIIKSYIGKINQANVNQMLPKLAERIKDIADFHNDSSGIVHLTYDLIKKLRPYFKDDKRFIFHGSDSRFPEGSLQAFLDGKIENGVLLSAGLSEGINLKGDRFGWQIIGKVLWKSLEDTGTRKALELSPATYLWTTLKEVMQASGRICRDADDYGVTYILDETFDRLLRDSKMYGLVPKWFLEMLEAGEAIS